MKFDLPPGTVIPSRHEPEEKPVTKVSYLNHESALWLLQILKDWRDTHKFKTVLINPRSEGMKFTSFRTKMYNARKWGLENMERHPDYYLFSIWSVSESNDGRARLEKTQQAVEISKVPKMEAVEVEADVINGTLEFVRDGQNGKLQNGTQLIYDDGRFDTHTLSAVKTILKSAGEKFSASTVSSEQIILIYINMDDPEVKQLISP